LNVPEAIVPMPKNKTINLLPQEEFDASTLGRVLKWAMGTFRIIVIVTEMIVMAAFLSRFWLDAQNSDLNDSISIKSAQILAQNDFEKQFRSVQNKLSIFKDLADSPQPSGKLNIITSKIPTDVVLSGVSIGDTSSQLKGAAGSEIGIAQFLSNLQNEKSFKTVDLGSLNTSENNTSLTVFTLDLGY
jgi:Tfp pilus assembly protein PilN